MPLATSTTLFPALTRRRVPAAGLVAAADVGLVMAALLVAVDTRPADGWALGTLRVLSAPIHVYDAALLAGFAAAVYLIFARCGLYDASRLRSWSADTARVLVGAMAVTAMAVLLMWSHPAAVSAGMIMRFSIGIVIAVTAGRVVRARVARIAAQSRRVVIVGSGPQARRICRELSADPRTRYEVLGFLDTSDGPRSPFMTRRTLGTLGALEAILVRDHVDEVHIGLPVKSHYPQIQDTLRTCERIGVKAMYSADIFGTELAQPRVNRAIGAAPRVELTFVADGWRLAVKRLLDVAGAALALAALAPLLIATAAAVRLTSAGPVIYGQERFGLNRRRFRMFKFRTMVQNAERLQAALETFNEAQGPVFKIADDPRITRLGRWLRRSSIDELPQLFNVLAGDMSLVGPRPLPRRDVDRFTRPADMRRFSVHPGLTGLWQVSGRSALGFDQWIALDLRYIDNWSLRLDAAILARTIPAVIRGAGAA
jgi:exopolysaccharide biosynthesis polyprenyl glycosylphosphotransferase